MSAKVLLVDDDARVLSALQRTLRRDGHAVVTAASPGEAIKVLREDREIAAIMSDYKMPGATGVEVLKEAAIRRPDAVRIMLTGHADFTAALASINHAGVSHFLVKPWNDEHLLDVVGKAVRQYESVIEIRALHDLTRQQRDALEALNGHLEEKVRQRTQALQLAYDETLDSLVLALDLREHSTAGHSRRVSLQALFLAMRLGIEAGRFEALYRGAMLHDIGKIGVPDAVLLKPGKLDPEERRLIEQHTLVAKHLLEPVGYLKESLAIPLYHHEWYDGTGYPERLAGDAIPIEARVFAVVDVYDALRNKRPYKQPMAHESASDIIVSEGGSHFDPTIVRLFLNTPSSIWSSLAETASSVRGFEAAVHAARRACDAFVPGTDGGGGESAVNDDCDLVCVVEDES